MITKELEIINRLGLHARAAAKLVHTSARFNSEVKIRKDDEEVDGKSILGILLLAAGKGSTIVVTAEGSDEQEALEAIEKLIRSRFDEAE
ncbi:MAG: HPr family phosphocarrier protein [Acidobacteriota bacterium]